MIEHERCDKCKRSRAAGYVLIGGRCVKCAPERVKSRRAVLKRQARELIEKETE